MILELNLEEANFRTFCSNAFNNDLEILVYGILFANNFRLTFIFSIYCIIDEFFFFEKYIKIPRVYWGKKIAFKETKFRNVQFNFFLFSNFNRERENICKSFENNFFFVSLDEKNIYKFFLLIVAIFEKLKYLQLFW